MHQYKTFAVKANESGQIIGYASTWDREPDSYGDIVKKGAFAETIEKWRESGKKIPLLWSHKMDDLGAFIGTVDPANLEEDDKGLHFVGDFDDTPDAQRARELYKDGRLSKFSFAYDVLDAGTVTLEDGTKANELRKLELFEISCVTVPANSHAEVVEVKAADAETKAEPEEKSGRRNSAKDADAIKQAMAHLEEAITLLGGVLGELDEIEEQEEQPGEDEPEDNAAAEDPTEDVNPEKEYLLNFIKSMEVNND